MTTRITDQNIVIFDNAFTEDFCSSLIRKFEKNIKKAVPGITGTGFSPRTKRSLDIPMYDFDWIFTEEIKIINDTVNHYLEEYLRKRREWEILQPIDGSFDDPVESGTYNPFSEQTGQQVFSVNINLQKTFPNGGYDWHHDGCIDVKDGFRVLTYIIYLNSDEKGWTQFQNGDQIQPTVGRILFFPACWTYLHRGTPPKGIKYIATNWISTSMERLHFPRVKPFQPKTQDLLVQLEDSV